MDREMHQEISSVFGKICAAADIGRVTQSSVEIHDLDPLRRALITSAVGSLLYEQYPESKIIIELVESKVIAVSITR